MRKLMKLMFVVAALSLAVTMGSVATNAQVPITVASSLSGLTTFTAVGGGAIDMTVGACAFGSNCWSGSNLVGPTLAVFDFSGGAQVLTALGGGQFSVSGPAIGFAMSEGADTLSGVLSLVSLDQFAKPLGQFNENLVANLNITTATGALAAFFGGSTGAVTVQVDINGGTDLTALAAAGTGGTTGGFSGAEIFPSPTPEPSSLLLLGSGILSFGGFLRRRVLNA